MSQICFNYDHVTKAFVDATEVEENPVRPGEYLMPAFSTLEAPPHEDGKIAVFANDNWVLAPDHRGEIWYDAKGEEVAIEKPGDPAAFDPPLTAAKPTPEPVVVIYVSSAQARTALFNRGLLDEVEEIVNHHPYRPVQIFYQSANIWEKTNPYVRAIAVELELLTIDADGAEIDNGLDDLFEAASKL